MGCAELQGGLLANCQEWHIVAAKRSDRSSTILQESRFANAYESRFPGRNVEIWAVLSSNEVDLLMLRNRLFMVRNAEMWAVLSSRKCDLLMLRNRVCRLRIVKKWGVLSRQCFIFCCSGIAYSGCETFKCGQCRHERTLVCWFWGIVFSGFETFKYG